jgi:regulator of nucleoside diphosphate kinase
MNQADVRITEVDSRSLQALIEGALLRGQRDTASVEQLERHLLDAEVVPASRIGPEVVTMGSEGRVRDLDSGETFSFRVVFPRAADAATGSISVLAPLGMAVLGRAAGEEITWRVPAGTRRLRVDAVLYQPEREGRDLSAERAQRLDRGAS